jgi:8-oxo-dGTP diphosphatase
LPEKFTLAELQSLTEVALGRPLDVRNFRRRVLESAAVIALPEQRRSGAHRPAQLFRFAESD